MDYGVGQAYPQQDGEAGTPGYNIVIEAPSVAFPDISLGVQSPEQVFGSKKAYTISGIAYSSITEAPRSAIGGYEGAGGASTLEAVKGVGGYEGYGGSTLEAVQAASKKEQVISTGKSGVSGGGLVQKTPTSSTASKVGSAIGTVIRQTTPISAAVSVAKTVVAKKTSIATATKSAVKSFVK
jgi:hypothetical protein